MSGIRIGANLIIWGKRNVSDFANVLDEVASLGYEGIEHGLDPLKDSSEPKKILSSRHLKMAGVHFGIDVANDKMVNDALTLLGKTDGRYLLFSSAGGKDNSDKNYLHSSKSLDKYGKQAKKKGIKVCYHNHWQEIINNAKGTQIVCENTDPEHVSLCVDTYWVRCGGMSPVQFIKEHSDRVAYLHLKDGTEEGMKKYEFTELGQGIIDFPAVMNAIKSLDVEWAVVEQDTTKKTPKESMDINRKYLKEKLSL